MAESAEERLQLVHTTSGGEPLGYVDMGEGAPVLWLGPFHAPPRAHWMLSGSRRFLQELARHCRLFLVDDRYRKLDALEAKQPVPDDVISAFVADAIAVLDGTGVHQCHVMGSLMTSMVGITLAARHPDRVASLLLWDPLLSGPQLAKNKPVRQMTDLVWGGDADLANRSWIGVSGLVGDASDAEEHKALFSAMQFKQIRDRIAIRGLGQSEVTDDAPRVACPTLVVLPRGAVMPGAGSAEAVAQAIPGARLMPIEGASISPDLEDHAVSMPIVLDWLAEQTSGSASLSAGATSVAALTSREREVCIAAARGLTNQQIAGELSISRWTVQRHISNAIRKSGAANRAALAALVSGQIEPTS